MFVAENPAHVKNKARNIRENIDTITGKIEDIKNKLRILRKKSKSNNNQILIDCEKESNFFDPACSDRKLRLELEWELLRLESLRRSILAKMSTERAKAKAQGRKARKESRDFTEDLKNLVKKSEREGSLSDEDLARAVVDAEDVIEGLIAVIQVAPTAEDMEALLNVMVIPISLGIIDSEMVNKAWDSLKTGSEKIRNNEEKIFRNNPTAENMKKVLKAGELVTAFGGAVNDNPPPGWKGANTNHTVQAGDTLALISQKYYGKPGYWDIILRANPVKIGANVRNLKIGITLQIP